MVHCWHLLFFTPLFVGVVGCGVSSWFVFTSYPGTTKYEEFVSGCIVLGLVDAWDFVDWFQVFVS